MILSGIALVIGMAFGVEGSFEYHGQYNVLASQRFETVYPASEAGKMRASELRAEGYVCQPKLQFLQCSKQLEGLPVLPESLSALSPLAQSVEFGAVNSMDLITQGDELAIFAADQTVIIDGVKTYSTAQYLERPDLVKITVGEASDPANYYSFVVYSDSVSMVQSVSKTESKWAYSTYLVEFYLPRK